MISIGRRNKLKIIKEVGFGTYLDAGEGREILLPRRAEPKAPPSSHVLDVFVYLDSEDRLIATTVQPYAMVGEVALLKVKSVEFVGAFLDWGLDKDLLVPFREQKHEMQEGESYLVYVYVDEKTERIVGTSKLDKVIGKTKAPYSENDAVALTIADETDIGFRAVVNNRHWGVLYHEDVYRDLKLGDKVQGYIKKKRPDGKLDLSLEPKGYQKIDGMAETILNKLKASGGFLAVTDKSASGRIVELFGMSKRNYKKAVGSLYKAKLIVIEDKGIRLVS